MNTRSYALRLAQELDAFPTAPHHKQAAAELRRLLAVETQRDALLEACKLAWPIIEKEKFMQDGCYEKNFSQTKAERVRKAYEATRAAIKAVEEA